VLTFTVAAGFGAAWAIERRNFPSNRPLAIDGRIAAAALALAFATFLMSNLSFLTTNTPFSGRGDREIFYIRTLVDFGGFIALLAMRSHRLHLERVAEVQTMGALLQTRHEQYLRSRHLMELVNSRYHDLKHYITAIRREPDAALRSEIVDQLEASVHGYASSAVQTGSPIVDAILGAESARAEDHRITVTCVVDGAALDFIDVLDVVTIFGNAMDNAIEATRRVEPVDRRLIRVAAHRQNDLVMLRVENYFGGDLRFDDGLPRTTKKRVERHGYGLKNVRAAAQKYGGTLTAHVEDGWFVLRVLLPVAA
jgi:sensor histidine kinase regulating citrate/malate metabolism